MASLLVVAKYAETTLYRMFHAYGPKGFKMIQTLLKWFKSCESVHNIHVHTIEVVAQLVRSTKQSIEIQVMNVTKQSGSADCVLNHMIGIRH